MSRGQSATLYHAFSWQFCSIYQNFSKRKLSDFVWTSPRVGVATTTSCTWDPRGWGCRRTISCGTPPGPGSAQPASSPSSPSSSSISSSTGSWRRQRQSQPDWTPVNKIRFIYSIQLSYLWNMLQMYQKSRDACAEKTNLSSSTILLCTVATFLVCHSPRFSFKSL